MAITHGGNIFAVAREHGWDWRDVADFSASINPLGPAPGVRAAVCRAADRIAHYPERESTRLRRLLAATWNVEGEQILMGNGATELIFFAARMWSAAFAARMWGAAPVTLAAPVFTEFHRAFAGAKLAQLEDPSTWPAEGVLVLTRPANPTGSSVSLAALENRLAAGNHPVLIDESFLEYSGLPSAATLLHRYPQLFILRSLTKFYALPGARIGALIGSAATLRQWNLHREPWQVSVFAEEAALAAVSDTAHAARSLEFMQNERAWLLQQLRSLTGAEPVASDANFLHIRLAFPAAALAAHLLTHKILIRNCAGWPGISGESVRIAVRRRDENERLLKAWRQFQCV
jgi:threonine-phosphate decarboxylase